MRLTMTMFFSPLLILSAATAHCDEGLFGNDAAATATGDVLEARGDLARGLGKGAYLRSLSAEQLQDAINQRLENRKERVEQYYELRDLRDSEIAEEGHNLSAEQRQEVITRGAPNRLADSQINRETGELYWPRPLDHDALKPYRRPIEQTLAKRASPGETYGRMDYLKVRRMVGLIREAVETIEDKLDVREVVALKEYLTEIEYEARYDAADKNVAF